MTEAEWQHCLDPIQMLQVKGLRLDDVSTARWRLFASGCLRIIWDELSLTAQYAVEAVENYVLGRTSADTLKNYISEEFQPVPQLGTLFWSMLNATQEATTPNAIPHDQLAFIVRHMSTVSEQEKLEINHQAGYSAAHAYTICRTIQQRLASRRAGPAPSKLHPGHPWHAAFVSAARDFDALASDVLRCVVGNPHRPIFMDPAWLSSTVEGLLTGIWEDNAYDRLPILADALEEAGCEEWILLNHCRYQARHNIGCWAAHLPKPTPSAKQSSSWFSKS